MEIRPLTPDFAVSPQIEPNDIPAIAAAGFKAVICNRPDMENPVELQADVMRIAVEAAGMTFILNPFASPEMTVEHVEMQAAAQADVEGPILAYCASGTRSSICWSLSQAGRMPTADIIAATTQAGYDLAGLGPQIDAYARQR
ncbi:MAG: TIGR01244 family sulfur transferase [Pseudomonadota bacterium]